MHAVRTGFGLICVLLLLVGGTGAVVAEEDGRFLVGTWNVGLFPWVNSAAIIKKIPKDFHVLGLTGVWSEAHAQAIIKALRKEYPFSYYVPAKQGTPIGAPISNPFCAFLGYSVRHDQVSGVSLRVTIR